jgi:hypothetical protein
MPPVFSPADNSRAGEYTPYYANHALEVIFHDITSMPTEDTDEQQILKVPRPFSLPIHNRTRAESRISLSVFLCRQAETTRWQ